MKTCAREHDKISYVTRHCPLCESVELTAQLLDLVVKQQQSVVDDVSLLRSTLASIDAGGADYNDSIQALFREAGKTTK